jgi:hypothetical protein
MTALNWKPSFIVRSSHAGRLSARQRLIPRSALLLTNCCHSCKVGLSATSRLKFLKAPFYVHCADNDYFRIADHPPRNLKATEIERGSLNVRRAENSITVLCPRIDSFHGWVACSHQASMNRDKQTAAHTDGLLMAPRKAVVVGGFEKPPKTALVRWPEHEVTSHFTGD